MDPAQGGVAPPPGLPTAQIPGQPPQWMGVPPQGGVMNPQQQNPGITPPNMLPPRVGFGAFGGQQPPQGYGLGRPFSFNSMR